MTEKIKNILDYSSECSTIDFKQEQYPIGKNTKKSELLKDISAMANFPSDEDKFIIIGVREVNGRPHEFYEIADLIDQAKYQQYLDSNIEPSISFEYKSINYKGHHLAYFRIFSNDDRPYLIKKEVRNGLDNNQIEFREGDGFIRAGTSTKKLTRDDFDKIYESQYKKPDRKNDLIITPYFDFHDDEMFTELNIKYFDISIENNSNHSIELDVEMKVHKGSGYNLFSDTELKKELKKRVPKPTERFGYRLPDFDIPPIDLHVDYKDFPDHILVSRIKLRNQKTALRLAQKDIENDIFNKRIVLLESESNLIIVDVIIRSDDFTDGLLSQTFEIQNNYIA